jgi:hypothetical protein
MVTSDSIAEATGAHVFDLKWSGRRASDLFAGAGDERCSIGLRTLNQRVRQNNQILLDEMLDVLLDANLSFQFLLQPVDKA